jgi:hypothetical protein
MKRQNKVEAQKELIKDLSGILEACDRAIKACSDAADKARLTRDLVITYEERERQYNKLDNMLGV